MRHTDMDSHQCVAECVPVQVNKKPLRFLGKITRLLVLTTDTKQVFLLTDLVWSAN